MNFGILFFYLFICADLKLIQMNADNVYKKFLYEFRFFFKNAIIVQKWFYKCSKLMLYFTYGQINSCFKSKCLSRFLQWLDNEIKQSIFKSFKFSSSTLTQHKIKV
ncbi:hypothetical protein BpHYR1_052722 [Brachionus plicatilis]|uniref:Uncharacterized protein n=1 Tax=Brachionus plicatilis TaxID=10195 RepID=A0A3M7SK20_BRAPC|nr:hypothetical protein BpHYR1_052722 [Brachionus plicatilis]